MRHQWFLFKICLLVWISTGLFSSESAAEEGSAIAVLIHAGRTNFSGSLTNNSAGPTTGFNLIVYSQQAKKSDFLGGSSSFFAVDFSSTKATSSSAPKFPFLADETLSLSETGIVPTLCILVNFPINACLGLGWTQMRVRDSLNEQAYGTFRGDFKIGHYFSKSFIWGLEGHQYTVDQEIAGEGSSFTGLAYQFGLGWVFTP